MIVPDEVLQRLDVDAWEGRSCDPLRASCASATPEDWFLCGQRHFWHDLGLSPAGDTAIEGVIPPWGLSPAAHPPPCVVWQQQVAAAVGPRPDGLHQPVLVDSCSAEESVWELADGVWLVRVGRRFDLARRGPDGGTTWRLGSRSAVDMPKPLNGPCSPLLQAVRDDQRRSRLPGSSQPVVPAP
jgi:hypothetical protein